MRRAALLIFAVAAFFAPAVRAQNFTNVTATVTDPNGIPYSGAVLNAYLVPQGPYTLGGFPYAGTVGPITATVNGVFNFVVGSNAAITPGGTQWVFQVTIQPGIPPPLGTGSQSFNTSASPQTISGGSTVNLSTLFNSLAPKLTNFGSGGGCPAGANMQIQYNASGVCGASSQFLYNATTNSISMNAAALGSGSIDADISMLGDDNIGYGVLLDRRGGVIPNGLNLWIDNNNSFILAASFGLNGTIDYNVFQNSSMPSSWVFEPVSGPSLGAYETLEQASAGGETDVMSQIVTSFRRQADFYRTGLGSGTYPFRVDQNGTVNVAPDTVGAISTSTLHLGGSGYALNDTGTFEGGNDGSGATYIVTGVGGGGAVTTYTVTGAGAGYNVGAVNSFPSGAQPGVGNSFAINVTGISGSSTAPSFLGTTAIEGSQVIGNKGSICTNGELALSSGWGNTASVSNVAGTGQTCQWTITSNGTGTAPSPTITDTLTNPLPSASIVCEMRMVGGTGSATLINQTALSATAPIFTFGGTPAGSSTTYFVIRRCGP